jgi:hypothetical protein
MRYTASVHDHVQMNLHAATTGAVCSTGQTNSPGAMYSRVLSDVLQAQRTWRPYPAERCTPQHSENKRFNLARSQHGQSLMLFVRAKPLNQCWPSEFGLSCPTVPQLRRNLSMHNKAPKPFWCADAHHTVLGIRIWRGDRSKCMQTRNQTASQHGDPVVAYTTATH